ncbi:MAG: hypothetical protein GXP55_14265 [Deltaproteobacteria bacterium]|nr:hypothetical protein [Deltaproteobacteria bacterium]
MTDPNDDMQLGTGGAGSLGGPAGGPSFEEEEKAMKSGRGRMMAMMVIGVLLAIGAFIFAISGGEDETYATFGRNINRSDAQGFKAFWGCAFQGNVEVSNNQELTQAMEQRASRGRARYGTLVRETCLPKLSDLEPQLGALIPPEDMREQLTELRGAVTEMRSGFSDWTGYLETLEGDEAYDPATAHDSVQKIAHGWFQYRRIHGALNHALREKLGH